MRNLKHRTHPNEHLDTARIINGWLTGIVAVHIATSSIAVVVAASTVTAIIVVTTTLPRR
jgi:hypothetical protein